jgi:ABC-type uncharacterized transport system ATPase subunit
MPPALAIEGLTVRFGPVTAVDDLTIAVEAGEVRSIRRRKYG